MGETRFPVDDWSVAGMVRQLLPLTEDDLYDLLARQDLAATQGASAVVRTPLDVAFIDLGTISLPERAELLDRGRSLFRKYNALAFELVCGECAEDTPHRERIEHARKGIGAGLEVPLVPPVAFATTSGPPAGRHGLVRRRDQRPVPRAVSESSCVPRIPWWMGSDDHATGGASGAAGFSRPDRLRGHLERGQVRGVRDDGHRADGEQPDLRLGLVGSPPRVVAVRDEHGGQRIAASRGVRSGRPREIDTIALASARRSMVGSYEWRSPSVKMRIMCSLKCRSSPRTG